MQMYSRIVSSEFSIHFPDEITISPDAMDLIKQLLEKDPDARPTFLTIKQHAFFQSIDWSRLERLEYCPPFRPLLRSVFDHGAFEDAFTNLPPIITPDDNGNPLNLNFPGFTYRPMWGRFMSQNLNE